MIEIESSWDYFPTSNNILPVTAAWWLKINNLFHPSTNERDRYTGRELVTISGPCTLICVKTWIMVLSVAVNFIMLNLILWTRNLYAERRIINDRTLWCCQKLNVTTVTQAEHSTYSRSMHVGKCLFDQLIDYRLLVASHHSHKSSHSLPPSTDVTGNRRVSDYSAPALLQR